MKSCESLFAVRILELQIAQDATFASDCSEPLNANIAVLNPSNDPLCLKGESANGCRDRLYDSPPDPQTKLTPKCWTQNPPPAGCLRGKWLPKCADGTDDGCQTPEAVCQDGTRPMAYMEPGHAAGSKKWVIFLGGEGGPCSGENCWQKYRYATELFGKSEFEKAMSTLHPDFPTRAAVAHQGIVSGNPKSPFAEYNRVKFKRCSDSASDTKETVSITNMAGDEILGSAPVWHHGFKIYQALFNSLASVAGRDLDGDTLADMPSLADAETILLVGSSDASVWLVHMADKFKEEIEAIAGKKVDVRIVIDGHFKPILDNEARYSPSAPADFNLFKDTYDKTGLCQLPDDGDADDDEGCSDSQYKVGPSIEGTKTARDGMDARGMHRDASCEAMHGVSAPQCYDKSHVLLHHVAVPFMVVADQEDSTISGARVSYAHYATYDWSEPSVYRRRVLDQAYDVRDHWATSAREEGAGEVGKAALLLRKSRRGNQAWSKANHVHFGNNAKFSWKMSYCDKSGKSLGSYSMAATIASWVEGTLPHLFIVEDADVAAGAEAYWVTGDSCIAPE